MFQTAINHTQKQVVVELQGLIRQWERRKPQAATDFISTGCDALDALFPGRGIRRGSLVEWIETQEASGAGTVALLVCRQLCTPQRLSVFIDGKCPIYPVALAALGFDLNAMILVRPDSKQEVLWASEEALRCEAVEFVWARIEQLSSMAFRRLQLAAEVANTVGFLVRPATAIAQPSWADVRLLVTPRITQGDSLGLRITVAYSRGRTEQSMADIEIDNTRGMFHEVSHSNQTHLMSVVS